MGASGCRQQCILGQVDRQNRELGMNSLAVVDDSKYQ